MSNVTAPLFKVFSITRHPGPYPGLRPFGEGERDIFFGRDSQIREVIERLRANHFAAILGGSGSGKSSLIRAGVIPDLRSHALPGSSDHWLPVIATPGEAPIERLAERLQAQLTSPEDASADIEDLLLQTRPFTRFLEQFQNDIRFGEEGLESLGARTNLLVVIDQFEEIFRSQTVNTVQAKALVRLITETFHNPHPRVYLVLTMRSEFLDHCTGSLELPDVLNATSYLTRRLNRAELEEVIVEPAKRYLVQMARDARHEPAMADPAWPFDPMAKRHLLNDVAAMSDDTDHLPLLQHCLYRLWNAMRMRWQASGQKQPVGIEMADLQKAVGPGWDHNESLLRRCLAYHADAIYQSLTLDRQHVAEEMFKLLAEVDEQGIHKRRWTTRREIRDVTGADHATVDAVIRAFSEPHPYIRREQAAAGETIDVSHESFIRNWRRFRKWLEEDRSLVECYEKLLRESQDWQRQLEQPAASFWKKLDKKYLYRLDRKLIDRFVEGQYIKKMSLPWAQRHYDSLKRNIGSDYAVDDDAYRRAVSFFKLSKARRQWQRVSLIGGGIALLLLFFVTPVVMAHNASIAEEREWLDVETKAFQPYAVASSIVGPATREREEWRPTRLWQAAVALRALEKLEDYIAEMPEPRAGLEFRQYRLERARRLAHSVSVQAVRDIAGSVVWPVAATASMREAPGSGTRGDRPLDALSDEDQACVRAVLTPAQQQQFAELVRGAVASGQGAPLLIRYHQGDTDNLAFGFQRGDACYRIEQTQDMHDVGPDPVFSPDLGMIIVSRQMSAPQGDEQVFFIHRLNWYTYCVPHAPGECRQVWRMKTQPPASLGRDLGAVADMGADGRSFFVQSNSRGREWFRVAEFDGAERLAGEEEQRVGRHFVTSADGEDAFGVDAEQRRLLHIETGREFFATPWKTYQIVAHAEAGDHLAFVYSGMPAPQGKDDRQAAGDSLGNHFFTILRVGQSEKLRQQVDNLTQLNLLKHPIASFDFFGPPIEQIVFGEGADEGVLYFRTEGDFYYQFVWGTGKLLERVCDVLDEAGLEQPIAEAFSPTFKMFANQEAGTVWQIVAEEGGPCPP